MKESQTKGWEDLYKECKARELPFTRKSMHNGKVFARAVLLWGEVAARRAEKRQLQSSRFCAVSLGSMGTKLLEILQGDSPIVSGLEMPDSGRRKLGNGRRFFC